VLLLVLAVSGYASVNRNVDLNLRLGAVNAQGLVIGEGGEVGTVQLGRLSTIVKPVAIEAAVAALSELADPMIGILTSRSQVSRHAVLSPVVSFPTSSTVGASRSWSAIASASWGSPSHQSFQ